MAKKFLRRIWNRYSRLGKKRKKKQKWRKPKGRDNKMREKRRGYPKVVSIGYGKKAPQTIVTIKNVNELKKGMKPVILAKIGLKKKIEIAKKGKELGVEFQNMNIDKIIGKEKKKSKKDDKKTKEKEIKNEPKK